MATTDGAELSLRSWWVFNLLAGRVSAHWGETNHAKLFVPV